MSDKSRADKLSNEEPSVIGRIFSRRMLICVVLGFSSGLPLYLLINLIAAWLRSSAVDLEDIGIFSAVAGGPYVWKFLWAPLLDRYDLLKRGRRRSWMLLTQTVLLILISLLGFFDPVKSYTTVLAISFLIAVASATQDVALDAYRREILPDKELGLGNSMFINAYRIAGMIPGGLSLILSDSLPWGLVFPLTALFMLPGIIASLTIREPRTEHLPRTLRESVVQPFAEFVGRKGWLGALGVIAFIFLYKFGDSMATAQATPFYIDMGYTKTQIGMVNKVVGLWSMVLGGIVGGILMLKIGINKALWLFGVGQIVTILGYVLIAHVWLHPDFVPDLMNRCGWLWGANPAENFEFVFPSVPLLSLVVGAEALGAGLGTACFVAYMCRETNRSYVATQLALFTALSAIPRTVCVAVTGYIINWAGWENFFIICFALAIPGMVMLIRIAPYNGEK
ncbi:AmpG family muropeptide MFS transporter [Succinimonas amylolytica]|uniref:AmpG family muropeptide MFS transporter n=1 Tax=Succinimonas amylolytica TaxID=83769 RepID=UPI0003608F8E|nr:AmpG family muropeptide MFS transporter [Succinimonas amylolytica]